MEATLEWLKNPEVFEINREKAHSDHSYFTSEGNLRQYLDGTWKFCFSRHPNRRPEDFYKMDFDVSKFDDIKVPGHIQLQGYDRPQYVNSQYPWEGREQLLPPQIPDNRNPVGSYVKMFDVDKTLLGKETYISFQGVETAFYVWLNGEFVGYSEDSFTPAEFNITPFLKEKDNKLAVEVYRFSTASWLEDQDFWRFSGIFRSVYIYAIPKIHIRDMKTIAEYDYEKGYGILSTVLDIVGEDNYATKFILNDKDGKSVFECSDNELMTILPNVKPWSAEEPNLYTLTVEISKNNEFVETAQTKVGFRTFELKNGIMCLNGKRIIFKGINRHEWNAQSGRVITKEDMLFDIKFMKRNNINAVRTSHYPNNSLWYELCDEYGIYLIDEANLESHGTWFKMETCEPSINVPASLPEWEEAVLDRAKSMYERDKNHPSVLIWSCGNESYCGDDIAAMADYFHTVDSTRLVHYEGVVWNRKYDNITDMESRMYANPADIEKYLKKKNGKPYISCEYMHAMGNSLGGMKHYIDLEDKYDAYQGGFIWDYIDQSLYKDGMLVCGGDFDERANDNNFCINGVVYGDRTISPKVSELKQLYANVRMTIANNLLTIENRNLFIDTSSYIFKITLEKEGKVLETEKYQIYINAGEKKSIKTNIAAPENGGEYVLTVTALLGEDTAWAEKGYEISFAQSVIKTPDVALIPVEAKAKIVYSSFCIGLIGEKFSMQFDKKRGGISSLIYNKVEYITEAPKISFFRAHTDNDVGANCVHQNAQWKIAGECAKLVKCKTKEHDDKLEIVFSFSAPTQPAFEYKVTYFAYYTGMVDVKVEYPGVKGMSDIPVFAMDFKLKKQYDKFLFYGMGPQENYIDRNNGAKLGLFSSTAEENFTKYIVPQECGNRTGVRYLKVCDENNSGLCFKAVKNPFEMSVLPYSAHELENASRRDELAKAHYTWVRIAAKQKGVGGDDSWGAPVHEEYKINSKKAMTLEFTINPL